MGPNYMENEWAVNEKHFLYQVVTLRQIFTTVGEVVFMHGVSAGIRTICIKTTSEDFSWAA